MGFFDMIKVEHEIHNTRSYNQCCLELLKQCVQYATTYRYEGYDAYLDFEPEITETGFLYARNTKSVIEFANTYLEKELENHVISKGKVVLQRHLPNCEGAGYDWIPDYDDYDETKLAFENPKIALHLAPRMDEEKREELQRWYLSIVERYMP